MQNQARRYKAVLFDVDGTIALVEERNQRVITQTAAKYGAVITKEDWKTFAGRPERVLWTLLKDRFPAFAEKISAQEFEAESRAACMKSEFNVVARAGIIEAIKYFKAQGLRVAAISNSPHAVVVANLKKVGALDLMEFIIGEDDVLNAGRAVKPAPDPYLMGAEKIGVLPEECLVVEDTDAGSRAGYLAGATVIQVLDPGLPKSDFAAVYAHNADEIRAVCRRFVP